MLPQAWSAGDVTHARQRQFWSACTHTHTHTHTLLWKIILPVHCAEIGLRPRKRTLQAAAVPGYMQCTRCSFVTTTLHGLIAHERSHDKRQSVAVPVQQRSHEKRQSVAVPVQQRSPDVASKSTKSKKRVANRSSLDASEADSDSNASDGTCLLPCNMCCSFALFSFLLPPQIHHTAQMSFGNTGVFHQLVI